MSQENPDNPAAANAPAHPPAHPPAPTHLPNAIDPQPIMGGEINIRLALSPRVITLLAAPATIGATMLLAWLGLKTLGMPVYPAEMLACALINIIGGVVATIPLLLRMNYGAAAIAQAGLLAIGLRSGIVLALLLVATAKTWGLEFIPLICWVLGYYIPMLIVETAVVAWLCRKAKH